MDERTGGAAARPSSPQVGMAVTSNTPWTGRVAEVIAATPGQEGAIRVAWNGDGETIVPLSACSPAGDRVMVQFATEAGSGMAARPDAMVLDRERVTVPILEEELRAGVVWREAGAVRLRVQTEEVPQSLSRVAAHEELVIEEVVIGLPLKDGEAAEPRREGDVWIFPIVEEVPVVTMRRMVAKEVRVTKRTVEAERTVEATVRRQRVEVDAGALAGRVFAAESEPANRGIDAEETAPPPT
jgi:uncharacterized protein (TIGR02271 family)